MGATVRLSLFGSSYTYNSPVLGVLYNRLLILLSLGGVFVAGYLTMAHASGAPIACGGGTDCDSLAADPSSSFIGIPVAVYGLIGYLLLLGIAVMRSTKGLESTVSLGRLSFALSGIGTLISAGLTYYSLFQLQLTCRWCIASAVIMSLILVVNILMNPASRVAGAPKTAIDASIAVVGLFLVIGGLSIVAMNAPKVTSNLNPSAVRILQDPEQLARITGRPSNSIGPEGAPITIIEFADMECPTCRASFPVVKRMVEDSNGKIRLMFRHFPLRQQHPMALVSAVVSEMAAEKGKFWDFVSIAMDPKLEAPASRQEVVAIAEKVGLDPIEVNRRFEAETDPALLRVLDDTNLAHQLGVQYTPTFIILADGVPPTAALSNTLDQILAEPQYQRLMRGESGQ